MKPRDRLRPNPWRRRGRIGLVLFLLVILLTLDLSPTLPVPPPPTPAQIEVVRNAARVVHDQLGASNGEATLIATTDQMEQVTALFSRLHPSVRATAHVESGAVRFTASRRLIGPVWVNLYGRLDATDAGFPAVALKIGRLPLGRSISGSLIRLAARTLRWRGIDVPPLDTLVRSVRVDGDTMTAAVTFPLDSGLIDRLPAIERRPIDAATVRFVYCRLVREDQRVPTADLAAIVQRAFAPVPGSLATAEKNRARLIALAMYTVSPAVGRLAPDSGQRAVGCMRPVTTATLVGRPDLAKHWTLSAALAVALGENVGREMGEWKELADSRPTSGSEGFSFVDLAADRAGLAAARRGSSANEAAAVEQRLATARQDDLLPVRALALAEGLSEADFVAHYRDQDSASFAAAIARIARVIAQTVGR